LMRLQQDGVLSEVRLDHPSLPLMGILDLVTIDEGGHVTIADFKTGEAKATHRAQLLVYAVLWWRTTGSMPYRIAVQYLDDGWDEHISAAELTRHEGRVSEEITAAAHALSLQPSPARPSVECARCAVRARCDEGWLHSGL